MPYKKTYTRKRNGKRYGRKKKTFTSTLYKGASTATKALAMAKTALSSANTLRGIINSEKKKHDTVMASFTNIDTNGQLVLQVNQISQGDTITQRTGNSILAKYLSVRGTVFLNGLTNAVFTVYVVQDNQQIGDTPPTFGDIFTQNFGHALLNSNTVGRYSILASKRYALNSGTGQTYLFDQDIPLNHHIRFNGTTASDIQKGGLYVLAVSDYVPAATTKPQFAGWSRLTYYDN